MSPRVRFILVCLLLGALTTGLSVLLLAYWPRTASPSEQRIDRDRDPDAGEGRGFISKRYTTGFGYQQAVGWASQQFITGGYNYATTTTELSWPDSMSTVAAPWGLNGQPWPPEGESRQVIVLRIGWPAPMLQGDWSQMLRRPRRPGPLAVDDDPDYPLNIITTRNWAQTNPMWSAFGGWGYMNAPNWLKSSRIGTMVFNKPNLPAVPTRPLWIGLIVNILFFSAAWWGLITVTGRVCRAIKAARTAGRCEWCRYPRAGLEPDAPCPECGKRPGRDSNPRPAV